MTPPPAYAIINVSSPKTFNCDSARQKMLTTRPSIAHTWFSKWITNWGQPALRHELYCTFWVKTLQRANYLNRSLAHKKLFWATVGKVMIENSMKWSDINTFSLLSIDCRLFFKNHIFLLSYTKGCALGELWLRVTIWLACWNATWEGLASRSYSWEGLQGSSMAVVPAASCWAHGL